MIAHRRASLLSLLALLAAAPAAAQALTPGRVVERIATRSDSAQRYALYLPTAYTDERAWPVLFLMDPRGRALVPLGLFREAAERHGFVLMSSYNTLSDADTAAQANEAALDALLQEAQDRIALDGRRLYLVGFSGTARSAWIFANRLRGHVAGVVGVGAGFPGNTQMWSAMLRQGQPFVFFGTAGELDYNYDEMLALDRSLDGTPVPHRFVYFSGEHSWPPAPVATQAGDWLALRAMAAGLAPRDEPFIRGQMEARMARAQALEASAPADALREYRSVVVDFGEMGDVALARRKAAALEGDRAVQRALDREEDLVRRTRERAERIDALLQEIRSGRAPAPDRAVERLRIAELRREAADSATDRHASLAARRLLTSAFISTTSYEPGLALRAGQPERALAFLRLAEAAWPGHPRVCYGLAQVLARQGDLAGALDRLACAVDAGAVTAATLQQDPLLEPLRADPRFAEIAARAPPAAQPPR